jgi:Xaa-Pro aminopeptidase
MSAAHLVDLRQELARRGLHGFIVPRADEHLGEYVPARSERLAWLTGFTGSAGLAIVLPQRAAVFTDGRYVLQLAAETDGALWERCHIEQEPPHAWLAAALGQEAAAIGYDPLLISEDGVGRFVAAGLKMVPVRPNPIDAVWPDQPGPPLAPAEPHPIELAGQTAAEKRELVAAALRAARQDAAVITDPASLAWLLNLRGADVPFTPFALGFVIMHASGACELFMDGAKLPPDTRAWLGNNVTIGVPSFEPGTGLAAALGSLRGKRVLVSASLSPAWFAQMLRAGGAEVVSGMDPCLLPKACKNKVEQEGARAAQGRDAIALCRFLHWMDSAAGRETERSAAAKLLAFREATGLLRGESFPAISGAGEHGAIIHYRVSADTDRPIRPDEPYLIDSGGQYRDGTTDVTRTVWTGPGTPPLLLCERFTRVLQGHIAIATLVFPEGVGGAHLDAFARRALWQVGLDYDHGTGHGIGSYLSVHEGPVGLSRRAPPVPIAVGMILSNEPGFYAPGEYGIRLENLLLVQPAEFPAASKKFLRFETLTLAPFDRRLIVAQMLTTEERGWLDAYHARVAREVGPKLEAEVRAWLGEACAGLAG